MRAIIAAAPVRGVMPFVGWLMMKGATITGVLLFSISLCSAAAELRLAATHTLNDSGLLDALLPAFQRESGIRVKSIIAGSGEALRLAERGDADLVWSHAPADEERFVASGFGKARVVVMTNAFVLL